MIDSKELTKLNKKLAKIGENLIQSVQEIPDKITQRLALGANDIRNTIIESMKREKKTGKYYKRGKRGKHQASAPGEAPAVDSGELIARIIFDTKKLEVEVGVEAGAPYAEFLEFGTSKMKARPFLAPAILKHEQAIIDSVGDGVFEIIGKSFERDGK